jgi:hypothetical protein
LLTEPQERHGYLRALASALDGTCDADARRIALERAAAAWASSGAGAAEHATLAEQNGRFAKPPRAVLLGFDREVRIREAELARSAHAAEDERAHAAAAARRKLAAAERVVRDAANTASTPEKLRSLAIARDAAAERAARELVKQAETAHAKAEVQGVAAANDAARYAALALKAKAPSGRVTKVLALALALEGRADAADALRRTLGGVCWNGQHELNAGSQMVRELELPWAPAGQPRVLALRLRFVLDSGLLESARTMLGQGSRLGVRLTRAEWGGDAETDATPPMLLRAGKAHDVRLAVPPSGGLYRLELSYAEAPSGVVLVDVSSMLVRAVNTGVGADLAAVADAALAKLDDATYAVAAAAWAADPRHIACRVIALAPEPKALRDAATEARQRSQRLVSKGKEDGGGRSREQRASRGS